MLWMPSTSWWRMASKERRNIAKGSKHITKILIPMGIAGRMGTKWLMITVAAHTQLKNPVTRITQHVQIQWEEVRPTKIGNIRPSCDREGELVQVVVIKYINLILQLILALVSSHPLTQHVHLLIVGFKRNAPLVKICTLPINTLPQGAKKHRRCRA